MFFPLESFIHFVELFLSKPLLVRNPGERSLTVNPALSCLSNFDKLKPIAFPVTSSPSNALVYLSNVWPASSSGLYSKLSDSL